MESIGSITLNISLDRFQTCSFSTHRCDRSPCHQHQHKHLGNSYQPLGNTWSLQRYVQSDQSMDATWTNKVNIRVQFSAVVVRPSHVKPWADATWHLTLHFTPWSQRPQIRQRSTNPTTIFQKWLFTLSVWRHLLKMVCYPSCKSTLTWHSDAKKWCSGNTGCLQLQNYEWNEKASKMFIACLTQESGSLAQHHRNKADRSKDDCKNHNLWLTMRKQASAKIKSPYSHRHIQKPLFSSALCVRILWNTSGLVGHCWHMHFNQHLL